MIHTLLRIIREDTIPFLLISVIPLVVVCLIMSNKPQGIKECPKYTQLLFNQKVMIKTGMFAGKVGNVRDERFSIDECISVLYSVTISLPDLLTEREYRRDDLEIVK